MDLHLASRPEDAHPDSEYPIAHAPLVTIAIPTFNRASLLRGCVASALSQTYEKFEVLVSDNASTDGTSQVLAEFRDDRLRTIRQGTNIGLLPNWNACLAEAKGDYVVFLSDDDRASPTMLERCVKVTRARPATPIVVTLSNLHARALGKTFPARSSRALKTGIHTGTGVLCEYLKNNITVNMCSVMLRTELLRAGGGFSLQFPHTGDIAAWAPLLFLGDAGFVNAACATYAYHTASETARLSTNQLLSDGWEMSNLISGLAQERVEDPALRRSMQNQARRCFARRGLTILSDYRKSGGKLSTIVSILWCFRRKLGSASTGAHMRFVATVLCPRSVADLLRRQRRGVSERLA
jgi:glycosyltransferase involved in cell wall biosynthesis